MANFKIKKLEPVVFTKKKTTHFSKKNPNLNYYYLVILANELPI